MRRMVGFVLGVVVGALVGAVASIVTEQFWGGHASAAVRSVGASGCRGSARSVGNNRQ